MSVPPEDPVMAAAFDAILGTMTKLPREQRKDFTCACLTLLTGMMRGTFGDHFTREYLEAALADFDKPSQVFVPPVRQ